MARSQVTVASLLPSLLGRSKGKGYCANLRQRMAPRYRCAGTFGTAANALDGSAAPQLNAHILCPEFFSAHRLSLQMVGEVVSIHAACNHAISFPTMPRSLLRSKWTAPSTV